MQYGMFYMHRCEQSVGYCIYNCLPEDETCRRQLTYLILTYLLTPYSTVLLEKLTSFQLVKKFPAFYGTRTFITAFTSVRHLSLF